jgi:hypothetical protein
MTGFPSTLLLLSEAIESTGHHLLADAPSLVIRRVGLGWMPMNVSCVPELKKIPGVNEVHVRVWGLCSSEFGTLTVRAIDGKLKRGEVIVGPGIPLDEKDMLVLTGQGENRAFEVVSVLPDRDVNTLSASVLMCERDARALLGLPEGTCSDIGLTFFHDEEAAYAIPEIIADIGFPVQIVTREDTLKRTSSELARWGGLGMLLMLPALISLFFFLWAQQKLAGYQQRNVGIMKVLGWTTPELLWANVIRSLLIGVPSVLLGLCFAWFMVYGPWTSWVGRFFFGWTHIHPHFMFIPAWRVFFVMGGVILIPFLVSQLLPLLLSAGKDPSSLLEGDERR